MKYLVPAALSLSLVFAPAHAAAPAPAARAGVPAPAQAQAHIQAVQNLLGAMQVEKVLRGVAARSRYGSDAQRQAVFAKLDRTPPVEVYRRMAPALAPVISQDTALEMTRFYNTPYGKQVIHRKHNSGSQIIMAGMKPVVPPEEKKERKRAAYVTASKQLADAEPMIEREAFKLLQQLSKEKR